MVDIVRLLKKKLVVNIKQQNTHIGDNQCMGMRVCECVRNAAGDDADVWRCSVGTGAACRCG